MGSTRRTLLTGVGAAAAGGLAGANSAAAAGSAATAADPVTPAADPVALGPAADIPVGGGKVYGTAMVVVTQPSAGDFKAFTSICTHWGCQVAAVENDQIICRCHGSRFSATDGSVLAGPATLPLGSTAVAVKDGQIILG
ncbi:Rieske (2Fe-2S) protein [Catellatospora bangladeshensis]|uniref:Rieske (2Fe-2S) protein n=1 Tax=Catellatospora bangladeshensis TaxID=310355 RepID=UPI001EF275B8|nr:Rieske (2Fe-2S) protein [Catellatospora bangladeshensis]